MLILLLLLAGFASQGGRATITYQPTPLEGDGQGCPSDENKAQVIENIHNLIEDKVETESTLEGRLLTDLNTAVETLNRNVVELSNTSQTVNGTLAELRQEVTDLTSASQIVNNIVLAGLNEEFPAESCREIFENRPDLPSGYYWIRSSNGTAVQLYCDMDRQCCNEITGGWTCIAYLNMTDPSQQCPPEWELYTFPRRACGRNSNTGSCRSVLFPSNGVSYSRVCGRIVAYQYCSPNAFEPFNDDPTRTIDNVYVDGISITHGSNPREHVWTFAAARYETYNGTAEWICPCTNINSDNIPNIRIPLFVGDDYFCDTGTLSKPSSTCNLSTEFFDDDPLWDGAGCGPTSTCCELNNPPWFCKILPVSQPVTDDIEVRICSDERSTKDDTPIELIELYVI